MVTMMAETANALSAAAPDSDPAIAELIPGLVWAFRLHSDGSAEPLSIDRPIVK